MVTHSRLHQQKPFHGWLAWLVVLTTRHGTTSRVFKGPVCSWRCACDARTRQSKGVTSSPKSPSISNSYLSQREEDEVGTSDGDTPRMEIQKEMGKTLSFQPDSPQATTQRRMTPWLEIRKQSWSARVTSEEKAISLTATTVLWPNLSSLAQKIMEEEEDRGFPGS